MLALRLDTKPLKILEIESKYQVKIITAGVCSINLKTNENFQIDFSDFESFFVFLDKLKIDLEHSYNSEDINQYMDFLETSKKKYNVTIMFGLEEDEALMFPSIFKDKGILKSNY